MPKTPKTFPIKPHKVSKENLAAEIEELLKKIDEIHRTLWTDLQEIAASAGVSNHSALSELDYASAGHTDFETDDNKVTAWSTPTTDVHYPSEKLVKDTIDGLPTGTDNHAELDNLDYDSAGHTGFEPTVTKGDLTATSPITLSETRQVIGGGAEIGFDWADFKACFGWTWDLVSGYFDGLGMITISDNDTTTWVQPFDQVDFITLTGGHLCDGIKIYFSDSNYVSGSYTMLADIYIFYDEAWHKIWDHVTDGPIPLEEWKEISFAEKVVSGIKIYVDTVNWGIQSCRISEIRAHNYQIISSDIEDL